MASFEVVSRQRAYDGWAKVDEVLVRHELCGIQQEEVKRLIVESGDACAVLIRNRDTDQLLFLRQLRIPLERHKDVFPLEIVAGKVDAGESPEEAALREVREEIGHRLGSLETAATFYPSPGILSEQVSVFYGEIDGSTKVDEGKLDEGEAVEQVLLTPREAFRMLDAGEIRDGKTLIALNWLRNRLS